MDSDPSEIPKLLLQHGLTFLARSLESMRGEVTSANLAFAAADLGVAVEALLKSRLAFEHWALVCIDVSKAQPEKFNRGEISTVATPELINRLKSLARITVPPEPAGKMSALTRLRNRAVHFVLNGEDLLAGQGALVAGLGFAAWFLQQELRDRADQEDGAAIEEMLAQMARESDQIQGLANARLELVRDTLDAASLVVTCPNCLLKALMLGDGDPVCAICGPGPSAEDSADDYVEAILGENSYSVLKDGGEWPVYECPQCERLSLVSGLSELGNDITACCFSCADAWPFLPERCTWCGRPVSGDWFLCPDCAREQMERD